MQCMYCHTMHVLPHNACTAIQCMYCHTMHVLPYNACTAIQCMYCHIMHVLPCIACTAIQCMHCHTMHVLPYNACTAMHACNVRKRTFGHVHPVKIMIGLCILAVKSESSLGALPKGAKFLHADSGDPDKNTQISLFSLNIVLTNDSSLIKVYFIQVRFQRGLGGSSRTPF